jgi:PPOX class probable F420-dependent enzyme
MSRRKHITMSDEEIQTFLQEQRTLQVATIDHDGFPHLVAMWYILQEQRIVFWTYAKSQKAVNLQRDPRLTCLVESGQSYQELRGVQIKGRATIIDDRAAIQGYGERIFERYTGPLADNIHPLIAAQAAKRLVVVVEPVEVVSWDHRKLGGAY